MTTTCQKKYQLQNLEDLKSFAEEFSNFNLQGKTIALNGDLGTGKTTFVKYLLQQLNYEGIVDSPSFILQNIYVLPHLQLTIEHWDLYRLNSLPEELYEPVQKNYCRIIEWANKFPHDLDSLIDYRCNFLLKNIAEGGEDGGTNEEIRVIVLESF